MKCGVRFLHGGSGSKMELLSTYVAPALEYGGVPEMAAELREYAYPY